MYLSHAACCSSSTNTLSSPSCDHIAGVYLYMETFCHEVQNVACRRQTVSQARTSTTEEGAITCRRLRWTFSTDGRPSMLPAHPHDTMCFASLGLLTACCQWGFSVFRCRHSTEQAVTEEEDELPVFAGAVHEPARLYRRHEPGLAEDVTGPRLHAAHTAPPSVARLCWRQSEGYRILTRWL